MSGMILETRLRLSEDTAVSVSSTESSTADGCAPMTLSVHCSVLPDVQRRKRRQDSVTCAIVSRETFRGHILCPVHECAVARTCLDC